jgi:hypothetical protein
VLLRHIMEAQLLGLPGIDRYLGQKPKLEGRYTDISLIDTSYSVGTLYIHVSHSFILVHFISVISFFIESWKLLLRNNLSLSYLFRFYTEDSL